MSQNIPVHSKHFIGKKCPKGHTLRYLKTGQCVPCRRAASAARVETPEAKEARKKSIRERNAFRYATDESFRERELIRKRQYYRAVTKPAYLIREAARQLSRK